MRKYYSKIREYRTLFIIFVIFSVIFSFIHVLRFKRHGGLPLEETYSLFSASKEVALNNFSIPSFMLSLSNQPQMLAVGTLFILSFGSLILFYLILSHFNVFEKTKLFTLSIFTLSPPFIYSFVAYTNYTFILFFILLFSYLYLKKNLVYATIFAIPLIFISLPSIIIVIILIQVLSLYHEDKNTRQRLIMSLSLIIISILAYFALYFGKFIPNKLFFHEKSLFTSTISDFGSVLGFGIFHFILAIIGIIIAWDSSRKNISLFIAILLGFLLSPLFPVMIIILNVYVSFFAGIAINGVYKKKWEIQTLKNITLILILYGLLFSCFSFENRMINSHPSKEEVEALTFLKNQDEGIVLSDEKNGFIIEYFSDKKPFLDNGLVFLKDGPSKIQTSNEIFYSRNLDKTINLLKSNDIMYIVIDSEMKEGLVFEKRNEGLLFIMDNSPDNFERIYNQDEIEIWKLKD